MVNGLSGVGQSYPNYNKQAEMLAKYATGTALTAHETGVVDGLGGMALFGLGIEGFKGANWARKNFTTPIDPALAQNLKWHQFGENWKNWKGMSQVKTQWNLNKVAAQAQSSATWNALKTDWKGAAKTFWNKQSVKSVLDGLPQPDKLAKMPADVQKLYAQAESAAKAVGKTSVTSSRALKVANARLAQANAAAHGTIKPTGFFGKAGAGIGKYTGLSKVNGWLKTLATKSPITAKALKLFKGNGMFLGILAATSLFTDVLPAFGLGADKGVKQVGKSAVKVGAEIGGWVVGAKAGAIAGAAIGTMIPIPVVGTVVGALCGLLGGIIGSNIAGKGAKAIVGKNEVEIAQDKQAKQIAKEAQKSPELMQELLAAAEGRMQQEGIDSPDAQAVLKIINPDYSKNIFAA